MICERCSHEGADVTDRGACMVAHCWACLADCPPCQDEMKDEADL